MKELPERFSFIDSAPIVKNLGGGKRTFSRSRQIAGFMALVEGIFYLGPGLIAALFGFFLVFPLVLGIIGVWIFIGHIRVALGSKVGQWIWWVTLVFNAPGAFFLAALGQEEKGVALLGIYPALATLLSGLAIYLEDRVSVAATVRLSTHLFSGTAFELVGDDGTVYMPHALAPEFQQNELRVFITGKRGKLTPEAAESGAPTPLTLLTVNRI